MKQTNQEYIIFGNSRELHTYHEACKIQRRPLIHATRKGKKLIHIEMDLIYCSHEDRQLTSISSEKLRTIHDYMGASTSSNGGGIYIFSYVPSTEIELAEFAAKAYFAVYKQNKGDDCKVPTFPIPRPDNKRVARMKEAQERHYNHTHTVRDAMGGVRWEQFCDSHQWACINVHEHRIGHATVSVQAPKDRPLTREVNQEIARIGQEMELSNLAPYIRKQGDTWYLHSNTHIMTFKSFPIAQALHFTQSIAGVLDLAGYFPTIDESWHL